MNDDVVKFRIAFSEYIATGEGITVCVLAQYSNAADLKSAFIDEFGSFFATGAMVYEAGSDEPAWMNPHEHELNDMNLRLLHKFNLDNIKSDLPPLILKAMNNTTTIDGKSFISNMKYYSTYYVN